jgi:hypothetical protein
MWIPPIGKRNFFFSVLFVFFRWMSAKYDGIRMTFDGENMYAINGKEIQLPHWLLNKIPKEIPLDCLLWHLYFIERNSHLFFIRCGWGNYDSCLQFIDSNDEDDSNWQDVQLIILDAPTLHKPYEERLQYVQNFLQSGIQIFLLKISQIRKKIVTFPC